MAKLAALITEYGVTWYDAERTILYCQTPRVWNWSDAHRVLRQVRAMGANAPHPTYLIFHCPMEEATPLPPGRAIPNLRRLILSDYPNNKLVILVGTNTLWRHLFTMTARVFRLRDHLARFYFAGSLHEASQIIEQHKHQRAPNAQV